MGETQPPGDWPGLEPERDGVTYDAQKISNIAGELREVMKPISGEGRTQRQGSINDLSVYGDLSDVRRHLLSIDNWQGGAAFAATLVQSYQEFITVYEDVLENFATAITLVEAGAGTYQVTNAANEGEV
ncbi:MULTISPECIES: hypothetical protein [unclassified Nonomuraea]|uniref:hypothetical protein n=1 Tax=unclassified Nonomuraea TaxID=2593643 RepID=UPI0035C244E0